MNIDDILGIAFKINASDIHLRVGRPPIYRINGKLKPITDLPPLTVEDLNNIANKVLSDPKKKQLRERLEVDYSYGIKGIGRYRVNMFFQRGSLSAVFRTIPSEVPNIEELNLPLVIKDIAMEERGLILVTGITGSGKSTTLAAMINHINHHKHAHIITIEEPIEFLHKDKKCLINQREVGTDTLTFANALRAALRQDPDIILVGEMRDYETVETALEAAETGHLVLSTLHTLNAKETINRIISMYPVHHQQQIRIQLAGILKGIISQRLIPRKDGKGRVPACEILRTSSRVRDCIINKEKTNDIEDAMIQGHVTYGTQTFDMSLLELYEKGLISYEEALKNADKPDDFALKASGISTTSDLIEKES